jgi:hypothetical protein
LHKLTPVLKIVLGGVIVYLLIVLAWAVALRFTAPVNIRLARGIYLSHEGSGPFQLLVDRNADVAVGSAPEVPGGSGEVRNVKTIANAGLTHLIGSSQNGSAMEWFVIDTSVKPRDLEVIRFKTKESWESYIHDVIGVKAWKEENAEDRRE